MERPTTNDARLSDEIQRWLADEARPTGRRECDAATHLRRALAALARPATLPPGEAARRNVERIYATRRQRRADGRCIYCGEAPPVAGRMGCSECLEYWRTARQAERQRRREESRR